MDPNDFRFCPFCAAELVSSDEEGHRRLRCPRCGWIRYRNPTVGVAVILLNEQGLWLGKRRAGGWCIPCGHVEWEETIREAALREIQEETGLKVELGQVFAVHSNFHDPEKHTVGIWYRGRVSDFNTARPGGDLVDLRPFPLHDLPELVYPSDRLVVQKLRSRQVNWGE